MERTAQELLELEHLLGLCEIQSVRSGVPLPLGAYRRGSGVNFALLPGENLRALAKRATGNEANWEKIAADNGLTPSSDLSGVQSIWVSDSLLEQKGASPGDR